MEHAANDVQGFDELSKMYVPEPPTVAQIMDAVKQAVDRPDVQTIFFVNFPPSYLDPVGTEDLKIVVDMMQSWQAWSSSLCEGKVQQQIGKEALPAGDDGQFIRSAYRVQFLDFIFRKSAW